MELDEAVRGRRAVRKYQDRDVPDSVIMELLDLARHAPSSMDGQPWHFIVVKSDEVKGRLVEIKNKYCPPEKKAYRADHLRDAPAVIIICVDKQRSYNREIENAVLAAAIIMLGAYSRGLGSVYMSAYSKGEPEISEEIRQIFDIPENFDPITIIPLGYPNETLEPKSLRQPEEMISYEKF